MSLSIGNVTKRIKSNKQNIKIKLNVNPEFEQSDTIKKRIKQNLDNLDDSQQTESVEHGDIIYNEHEVINIPKKLDNLFDNLLCDNYYLYGISINSVSFLNSLLYILLSDFKFKNNAEQETFSNQLKENLINELGSYFKKNKYGKMNFKKSDMEANIENNEFKSSELHYLADYYNINLVVLDYYKFSYYTGNNYNESNNNVIIIKYNDIYLPLIHIFGEFPSNLIYKCIINKLKINNLENVEEEPELISTNEVKLEPEPNQSNEPTNEVTVSSNESPLEQNTKKLELKAISSYKLNELQDICKTHNISLTLENGKKKTKKQLYEGLLSCCWTD